MRYAGQIVDWNDERGFGFVVTNGSDERIFFHISQLQDRHRRPAVGERVTYITGRDTRGRLQAQQIAWQRRPHPARGARDAWPRAMMGLIALALVIGAAALGALPLEIAGLYLVTSVLSFLAYRADKAAARRGSWRTAERTLHLLDLLGGWPGALIAQQRFHHKTIKQPFQILFWLSVAVNLAGMAWLLRSGVAARLVPTLLT